MEKLIKIQSELRAPKSQFNSFGKYKYRNQEDILEAVKPLLAKYGCTLVITDHIVEVGGLVFINATATIDDGENQICVSAQAGIDPNRKGMDIAQSFGSSSSYARKYALNGLFLIDDTKDADATNTHGKDVVSSHSAPINKPSTTLDDRKATALSSLLKVKSISDVKGLIEAQKSFKASSEGASFTNGATIEDVVKLNTIELVGAFYKFVKG